MGLDCAPSQRLGAVRIRSGDVFLGVLSHMRKMLRRALLCISAYCYGVRLRLGLYVKARIKLNVFASSRTQRTE